MQAVANSSVLISLSFINQLDLLRRRFPAGVLIPEAVWREVVLKGQGRKGAQEVAQANWITVEAVQNKALVSLLRTHIDEGEAEAIVLAQEQKIIDVLLDERAARQLAWQLGLSTPGTVGVLIWAKQAGLIPNLQQQLDTLQTQGKFRLSRTIYEMALRTVGEII